MIARSRPLIAAIFSVFIAALLGGCVSVGPDNPAIKVSESQASDLLRKMERDPKPLARPVVVLGGYRGPESETNGIMATLADATSGKVSDFAAVSYRWYDDLDEICDKIVREVNAKFPSKDPASTIEVDVVGISLGGLAARWAAIPPEERVRQGEMAWRREDGTMPTKRLKIVRLYTVVAPHQGVTMSSFLLPPGGVLADMGADSGVVTTVNRRLAEGKSTYEVVAYGSPRDSISGDANFAPPGMKAVWTGGNLTGTHWAQIDNPIFYADIARRLRGEEPVAEPTKIPE
jgi:hypothetical protein